MASSDNVFQDVKQVDRRTVTFRLQNTDVAFANTLRRLVLTSVETVGFRSDINELGATSDVNIKQNTTSMTNEMLADRIGLIPIAVKDPLAWDPEKYTFKINVTNKSSDLLAVTASEFEVTEKSGPNGEEVKVPNTEFFHPDPVSQETILIAVLKGARGTNQGDTIELEAKATIGMGREHSRFNPVSQCAYKYTRDPNEQRQEEMFNAWLTSAKKITDLKGLDADMRSSFKKEFMTMEIDRCFLTDQETGEPNSFDFTVETVGTMSVQNIIARALKKGATLASAYTNLESQALPTDLRVQPAANRLEGFDFVFQKQDHTLGNLLASYIDLYLLDGSRVTYVSYTVPHPLRDEMLLRIGIAGGQQVDARRVLSEAARGVSALFAGWQDLWRQAQGLAPSSPSVPIAKPKPTGQKVLIKKSAKPAQAIA
jgi:DNA-directed RNA polymerase subunit L